MDRLSKNQRSALMKRVRRSDTGPERILQDAVRRRGYAYTTHDRTLPGTPDLVLTRSKIAVFVHGCFWHGHGCAKSRLPRSNRKFWQDKVDANGKRDRRKTDALRRAGYRVWTLWECVCLDQNRLRGFLRRLAGAAARSRIRRRSRS